MCNNMKIILVATDARGKNLVFVSDTLRAYSLQDAVALANEFYQFAKEWLQ